jgi:hypothetical protein
LALAIGLWSRQPAPPEALASWTDVAAVASPPRGVPWRPLDAYPAVAKALRGTDPEALRDALGNAGLDGLWVAMMPRAPSEPSLPLRERFASAEVVRGFRGEYLTSEGLLYVLDDTTWPDTLTGEILGRVARVILEGSEPPPRDAFPEALRRRQPVEVLVLLRGKEGPRLWRSARAESIADGLNTAALAARKRWDERSETMGGPLVARLDALDVEVALLFDDGTLAPDAVSLIDALVKPVHGVAYEQPTRWRYLLPAATHSEPTPTDAFRVLFLANGLAAESFDRADLRLYRIRLKTLSVDHGSAASSRGGD